MNESRKYKGKRYTIVLNKGIADKVEALADKEDRSISQTIARLVEAGLDSLEDKTKD